MLLFSLLKSSEPSSPERQQESEELYGDIKGTHPTIKHPDLQKTKSLSLTTKDIYGAHADSLS